MPNLLLCKEDELPIKIKDSKIVCFGAGKRFSKFLMKYMYLKDRIICILDNSPKMQGKVIDGIPVLSLDDFLMSSFFDIDVVIIITVAKFYGEILEQLNQYIILNNTNCFIDILNEFKTNKITHTIYENIKFLHGENKIPKKIHYCWFGKNSIPSNLRYCIDSWKKYCPDYKIIKWDESNYDVTKNSYMRKAYEHKKYGFVPDYARLDIIYQYGGIYLDTDVEILRNFDDLLPYEFFCGFENNKFVALGLGFGAIKHHPITQKMLLMYNDLEFENNGKLNLTGSPKYQSTVMKENGFLMNGEYQEINGVAIFPTDIFGAGAFDPLRKPHECIHSIHHYEGSWIDKSSPFNKTKKQFSINISYFKRKLLKGNIL